MILLGQTAQASICQTLQRPEVTQAPECDAHEVAYVAAVCQSIPAADPNKSGLWRIFTMSLETILIIVVLVFLLGGGGWYWGRGRG